MVSMPTFFDPLTSGGRRPSTVNFGRACAPSSELLTTGVGGSRHGAGGWSRNHDTLFDDAYSPRHRHGEWLPIAPVSRSVPAFRSPSAHTRRAGGGPLRVNLLSREEPARRVVFDGA